MVPSWSTRTVVAVPSGVWARTLARRLSITWRRRVGSPMTSTGCEAVNSTGHCGPTVAAVCTASAPSPTSSVGTIWSGRPSSKRARVSRSLTRRSMRAVSERMPVKTRGRSSALSGRAPLEELGVGGHGGDRRAQLVRGVGHELAQVPIRLLQPGLGGHPGREGRLDPLQHDVEGTGQPADLGGVVGPGHPLVEISRRDGVGRALDVFERAQAQTDQPPTAGQGQDQRAGGHRQLNEQQRVQRAGGVPDGLGHHAEHVERGAGVFVLDGGLASPGPGRRARRSWSRRR